MLRSLFTRKRFGPTRFAPERKSLGSRESTLRRFIERLEARFVPATLFNSGTGLLSVIGDETGADNDVIDVSLDANNFLAITFNGVLRSSDPGNANFDAGLTAAQASTVTSIEIRGGDGNDDLTLGEGFVAAGGGILIDGGTGNNQLRGSSQAESLVGGDSADTLRGGGGNDTIMAAGGDDQLEDGAGADLLDGGSGNDVYLLTLGGADRVNDTLGGNDRLDFSSATQGITIDISLNTGGAQRLGVNTDTLALTGLFEEVVGSNFADSIFGDSSENRLTGGNGDDILVARAGNDSLFGGDGNDQLDSGDGDDQSDGGDGNDFYSVRPGNAEIITDSNGLDSASFATSTFGVTLNLGLGAGQTQFIGPLGQTLVVTGSIENAVGSALDDVITGSGDANSIDGGDGNDRLVGLIGNDTLSGGLGDDTLDAGDDVDSLVGGAGNDNFLVTPGGSEQVSDTSGTDTLDFSSAVARITIDLALDAGELQTINSAGDALTLTGTFENVIGTDFADAIAGNAAANSLIGGLGDDGLTGRDGNDTLLGGSGADVLNDGAGSDLLNGAEGDDLYVLTPSPADIVTDAGGIDTLDFVTATRGINLTLSLNVGQTQTIDSAVNTLALTGTFERLDGSDFDDTFVGTANADQISGRGGNDQVTGGAANDTLDGGTGNDTIRGEAGDDSITGGSGQNLLFGGDGNDSYNGTPSAEPDFTAVNDLSLSLGKTFQVPLDGLSNGPLTYTVSIADPRLTGIVPAGNRSMRITVSGSNIAGDIVLQLFEDLAPRTTARIIQLINGNFYDGLTFHRVIQDFVVQGGDPNCGTNSSPEQATCGSGGSGVDFDDEFNRLVTFTGIGQLAMANARDDDNDSQFFITDSDLSVLGPPRDAPEFLNFNHNIFGQVTEGLNVLAAISATATNAGDRPLTPVRMTNVDVFTDTQNAVLRLESTGGALGTIPVMVTVSDSLGRASTRTFNVTTVADSNNDAPFLGNVDNQTTNEDTPLVFNVPITELDSADTLQVVIRDGANFNNQPSTNVTALVTLMPPATPGAPTRIAQVTLTPAANFNGTVNLRMGVWDGMTRRPNGGATENQNFDTQPFTLTVRSVNDIPTVAAGSASIRETTPTVIQLNGADGDPDATQTLTFEIVTQPTNGVISNFNAATGSLTYTANAGFRGNDPFTFRVRDDGGVANGGVDVSQASTFSIEVFGPGPLPPTNPDLATASDTGTANDDNFTADDTPTLTVAAEAGRTVEALVNGTVAATATESTAGQYSVTLPTGRLRLGDNAITFTARDTTGTSAASAPVNVVYAPSFEQSFVVAGTPSTAQAITFRHTARAALFNNEIGMYIADAADGTVNGVAPGNADYARTVLNDTTRQVLFAGATAVGTAREFTLQGGQAVGFYLIQNNTAQQFLATNATNATTGAPVAFFSFRAANPDGLAHVQVIADPQTGRAEYRWEDQLGGGDRDFNDFVLFAGPTGAATQSPSEALRVPGGVGQTLSVTAQLLPALKAVTPARPAPQPSSAPLAGELGLFQVDAPDGSIGTVRPGDTGYVAAAFNSTTRQAIFSSGQAVNTSRTLTLNTGRLVGLYYIPNGTSAGLLATNPNNTSSGSPVAFFSFDTANPDAIEHFRLFEPERNGQPVADPGASDAIRVHIMDELLGAQTEFDDILFTLDLNS